VRDNGVESTSRRAERAKEPTRRRLWSHACISVLTVSRERRAGSRLHKRRCGIIGQDGGREGELGGRGVTILEVPSEGSAAGGQKASHVWDS
jgi:hypothetical protein